MMVLIMFNITLFTVYRTTLYVVLFDSESKLS